MGVATMTGPVGAAVVLVAAGVLAGVVGTAGGITSLVSYPALLAVGVPPLPADVANLVAGVGSWPSSALTSVRELAGTRALLTLALPVAAAGAVAGSVLLLATPPGAFALGVPWLLLAGSATIVAEPWLTRRRRDRPVGRRSTLAAVGVLSVYSGYFGAGSGVLLLALLLVTVDRGLPRANAVKNMLVGASGVASAAVFVTAGPVAWRSVVPLAAGLFLGGLAGPGVARRVPPGAVRWTAAALGVVLALELWLHPG